MEGFIQIGAGMIRSIEFLPFFLVTIESGKSLLNSLSYSWRICFVWLIPVMMILSFSTYAEDEGIVSVVFWTRATFVWNKDAVAGLRVFTKPTAWVDIDTCYFITRFLCNLSLISCSNKQGVCVSVGGNFGTWPVNQTKYQWQNGAIRQQWEQNATRKA